MFWPLFCLDLQQFVKQFNWVSSCFCPRIDSKYHFRKLRHFRITRAIGGDILCPSTWCKYLHQSYKLNVNYFCSVWTAYFVHRWHSTLAIKVSREVKNYTYRLRSVDKTQSQYHYYQVPRFKYYIFKWELGKFWFQIIFLLVWNQILDLYHQPFRGTQSCFHHFI